jgi:oxygen-independent coproporphyrinogen-3 oxidase
MQLDYEGVYVHTPFCMQKCLYCDFASYAGLGVAVQERYVADLCREIRLRGQHVRSGATIFFGGGTPTVLTTDQLTRIVTALQQQGIWRQPAEATIEANPGTVDLAKLKALRALGFDRLSLGVQSLNDTELKTVGRIHTAAQALEAIRLAQQAGFTRINADVITGLPGQTVASLQTTLTGLIEAGLTHLSVYSLILEPGTPLEKLVAAGKLTLPDEDLEAELYQTAVEFLQKTPLQRYEVSNYAVPGQESRHNLLYWHYRPYLGLGAAAVSFNGRDRFNAVRTVAAYCEAVEQAGGEPVMPTTLIGDGVKVTATETTSAFPWGQVETLTNQDHLEEYLFLGLRTTAGLNLREAQERFHCDVWTRYGKELQTFMDQGCLVYEPGRRLFLTSKGLRFGNRIFEVFIV